MSTGSKLVEPLEITIPINTTEDSELQAMVGITELMNDPALTKESRRRICNWLKAKYVDDFK